MPRVSAQPEPGKLREAPQHLSFSQLTMLHPHYQYSCPRKWAYRYLINLSEERSPALALGSAMDEGINAYFSLRMAGVEALEAGAKGAELAVASLQQEVEANPQLFNDPGAYEGVLMAAYTAFLVAEGRCEVARIQDKHVFRIQVGNELVPILGYSDRIDQNGTIVDHKYSGSPRWDQDGNWKPEYLSEKHDQLLLYWLARQAEERKRGHPLDPPLTGKGRLVVVYHKLGLLKAQVQSTELDLDMERATEVLLRVAEASVTRQEGSLPLRPGQSCRFCSFLARCREDQAARGMPFMKATGVPF